MFISSAMSAVVTCGAPEALNSARLVSRMRSRVRRGRLRSAVVTSAREPTLQVVERVREIARRLPYRLVARLPVLQRPRVDERVADRAARVCEPIGAQANAVLGEPRRQRRGAGGDVLARLPIRGRAK